MDFGSKGQNLNSFHPSDFIRDFSVYFSLGPGSDGIEKFASF